jgi:hypothetical protein
VSRALVDIITIGGVIVVYLFLFWVARAMRAHLGAAADPVAPPLEHRLEVKGPEGRALSGVSLAGPVVVGRSPEADLTIDDPFASDFHARIGPAEGGSFRIQDLGSTNGTFVDGARITGPVPIGPGEEFQIGQTIMGIR